MKSFAQLDKRVSEVDLVFFRGSKEELIKACRDTDDVNKNNEDITIKVNVHEKGSASSATTQRIQGLF
jgi:hypothetical protein